VPSIGPAGAALSARRTAPRRLRRSTFLGGLRFLCLMAEQELVHQLLELQVLLDVLRLQARHARVVLGGSRVNLLLYLGRGLQVAQEQRLLELRVKPRQLLGGLLLFLQHLAFNSRQDLRPGVDQARGHVAGPVADARQGSGRRKEECKCKDRRNASGSHKALQTTSLRKTPSSPSSVGDDRKQPTLLRVEDIPVYGGRVPGAPPPFAACRKRQFRGPGAGARTSHLYTVRWQQTAGRRGKAQSRGSEEGNRAGLCSELRHARHGAVWAPTPLGGTCDASRPCPALRGAGHRLLGRTNRSPRICLWPSPQ